MKELSIEEKAKRYDEAKYIMEEYLKSGNAGVIAENTIKHAFPELREESEDERIRKAMIDFFKHEQEEGITVLHYGVNIERIIDWLEKQGESTETNPSEFDSQLNRLLKQFESLSNEDLASSLSFYLNVVQNDGTYKEKKQGEQKTADVRTTGYWHVEDVEQKPDAWSEEDVAMLDSAIAFVEHSAFTTIGKGKGGVVAWLKSLKNRAQPQKQEWSDVDKDILFRTIDSLKFLRDTISKDPEYSVNIVDIEREITLLKSLKDRVQQRRNEKTILEKLEEWLGEYVSGLADVSTDILICSFKNYLNGKLQTPLKDRVQLRNKWKESLATADLENSLCDIQDGFSDTSYEYRILGEAIEFIRCTEPKPQWKPSDEQMKALANACNGNILYLDYLNSLYNDLKKLKEE